ncbi:MAG: hypothetical protein KGJ57_18880 [Sphingomonadales bacterium]|nr:hypothetical protein [Sphingomonadales bacterium]MDE2171462.1 hypothetical protein [Sphingomonadales bacterium]
MSGGEPAFGGAGHEPEPEPEVVVRFPATPNQHLLWREMDFPRSSGALNATFRRRLEGSISDKAVTQAINQLVERHEILRTRFRMGAEGQLEQQVLRQIVIKPSLVDLRPLPSPRREEELERLGAADAREPFDVAGDGPGVPLFRVLLVRLAQDVAYVHFTFHQLIVDGWSIEQLEEEFARLAVAVDSGVPADLAPADMQFGDYAMWQRDVLASGALDGERDYWRRQLSGLTRFEVAPDRPGPRRDSDGQIRSILLPRALSDAFEALARANSHTLFSLATAAAAAALHLFTGRGEVVVGTQTAGREDPDSERIVGSLINTVVLRLPVREGEGFLAFAGRVRAITSEAMDNRLLPFAEVIGLAGEELSAHRSPLYSVNLVVQRSYIKSGRTADKDFGAFRMISATGASTGSFWDLSLFMVGREEGWRLSCEGADALYDTATVDALLSVWRKVIEAAVARPEQALVDILAPDQENRARPEPRVPPPSARYKAETQMTASVRNPRLEAIRERIIALQPKGDKMPVIAINNASVLYPVARAIGKDHPFFDLPFCPPQRMALPKRHFRDHARDAVEMIRLVQPHGPYVLFGFCLYGAVAIEAARLLRADGEDVPLVILNDTYRPGFRERMPFLDRQIRKWVVRVETFRALHQRVRSGELTVAQWIDNYRILRALRVTRLMHRLGLGPAGEVRDALQDNNRWFAEEVLFPSQAEMNFESYPGDVLLFRSMEMKSSRLFPRDFGWSGHVGGQLSIIDVPGTHDTIFRSEGAAVIGPAIRAALEGLGF